MFKKFIYAILVALISCNSFAQSNANETPEIRFCRQTSDVHNRVWQSCLYLMGELVAKQVKETYPENFSKYALEVANKCRILRKKLEEESGGAFPGHVSPLLA